MKKILIIENSIVIRSAIRNLFIDNQRVVTYEANSMKDSEELIKKNDFFVAVTNLFLEDSPNSEILSLLEKYNIPTIIFSSNLETELLFKYSNIIDYVLKNSNGFEYIKRLITVMKFCRYENVLLVEDSTIIANQIKQTLERLLLKVTVVKDGKEALDLVNENKTFSLIISDYEIPNLNGLELTKKIRDLAYY